MDAVKIAPTPLEAITAHATLVFNLQQIIRAVQVNRIFMPKSMATFEFYARLNISLMRANSRAMFCRS